MKSSKQFSAIKCILSYKMKRKVKFINLYVKPTLAFQTVFPCSVPVGCPTKSLLDESLALSSSTKSCSKLLKTIYILQLISRMQ